MGVCEFDVLIVGAGLSGIAAGYYVQSRLPGRSYAIIEARESLGGTWDLFRYPGVRSDSDMHTLGYSFRPWRGDVSLADGPSIKQYIQDTAAEFGIDRHIRYGETALHAEWQTDAARWTVTVKRGGETLTYHCRFLSICTGYYDYERGYLPEWSGVERFRGSFVHPQAWPEHLDYRDKRVLVIGSGATAVTLVPAIAASCAHVTMLQRSPTYILSLPSRDVMARAAYKILPAPLAHRLIRWKNIVLQSFFYQIARRRPEFAKRLIKTRIERELGPGYDVDRHFTPQYNPWDQRLCLVPNSDLFGAIREGTASIVTGEIERFTETGLVLKSGDALDADVIVAATGLNVKLAGGMALSVDGKPLALRDTIAYKGMMFCGVPNLTLALGYTNASWTLKCELTALYLTRLVRHLDKNGYAYCAPAAPGEDMGTEAAISLTSGYITRAAAMLPKQGTRAPWRLYQNYALDLAALRFGRIRDGVMEFMRA